MPALVVLEEIGTFLRVDERADLAQKNTPTVKRRERQSPFGGLRHLRLRSLDGVQHLVWNALHQVDKGEVPLPNPLQRHEILLIGAGHGWTVLHLIQKECSHIQNHKVLRRCQRNHIIYG